MFKFVIFLAFLIFAASCTSPVQSCENPIDRAKIEWAKSGITVTEGDAKAVTDLVRIRYGETVDADQVFLLAKPEAPNVVIVFAKNGCATQMIVLSKPEFNALIYTRAAVQ